MDLEAIRYNLTGPLATIRTPFKEDGDIDYPGLRRFIDVSVEGGSRSIILTAGNAMYHCLSDDEIADVTRVTCKHTAGRAMVVAADRYHATARAVAFAEGAKSWGADIVMCSPPTPGGCTPETLSEHFATVAKVMPVMVVTNVFQGSGPAFGLETLKLTLDKSENVLAIKDDLGGPFAEKMCLLCHERCAIFAGGKKSSHLGLLPFGCDGYMSRFVTFRPDLAARYWEGVQALDMASARKIISDYEVPLIDFLFNLPSGYYAGMQGMLELFGIASRWRRMPYSTLADKEMADLTEFLKSKEILP